MKTLTLVLNFGVLWIFGMSILSGGFPDKTKTMIMMLGVIVLTLLNIVIISGSSFHIGRFGEKWISSDKGTFGNRKRYTIIKIIMVLLNMVILGYALWALKKDLRGSGLLIIMIKSFILSVPILSILRISFSRWNRFAGIKRTILLTGASLAILFSGFMITMQIWIGQSIKENIDVAKAEYPGKAEDALLAYLADSTKSPRDRSAVAIWTLGQIRSRKALPVLKELYKNDPDYHCKHSSELCQYEIHKAIVSIEHNWLGAKEKNWFGSFARFNK